MMGRFWFSMLIVMLGDVRLRELWKFLELNFLSAGTTITERGLCRGQVRNPCSGSFSLGCTYIIGPEFHG